MRGILGPFALTSVQVLVATQSTPDRLGQSVTTWVAALEVQANVQPLGSEEAARMQLAADRERWRVQLPAGTPLVLGGRLRMRGRDWKAVRVEAWQHYHLVVVEGV